MRKLATYILSLVPIVTAAQGYTLEECRQMALRHNLTLQSSRLDILKADEDRKKAFTTYFPDVSGIGAAFWADDYMIQTGQAQMLKDGRVAALSAVQPVFAGGQIVNANRLAKVQQEVASLKYQLSEDEVTQRVTESYWQIVSLQANIATLDAADGQLVELQRTVMSYVRAGMRMPADTLQIALKRQELESSRLQADNALSLSLMSLARLMGISWKGFAIRDTAFVAPTEPTAVFLPAETAALGRKEYALSELAVDASRLSLRMERGKLLPSVGLGVQGVYANLIDKNETHGMLYATVSVPISAWWGGSHAIRKARYNRQQAELAVTDARQNLALDIQHAWNSLVEAYRQIDVSRRSIDSARENYRMQKSYYHNGTATMSDLLQAESQLIQAENRLAVANATYQVRLADYRRKTR